LPLSQSTERILARKRNMCRESVSDRKIEIEKEGVCVREREREKEIIECEREIEKEGVCERERKISVSETV